MSGGRKPATALIGAGRLGSALAPLLAQAGYPITAVASRDGRSARRLCRRLGLGLATGDPVRAADRARLVLLAVPDRSIESVAGLLAERLPVLRGRIFLHHAGALGTEPLKPLARAGAAVAVLHPLQTLGPATGSRPRLAGCAARIEGDAKGVVTARRLARDLGLAPLPLPERMRPSERQLYHAAAAIASNDLVALLDGAVRLLERVGLDRAQAIDALLPLMRGTLDNVESVGPETALTGPVARGDAETLSAHLQRLSRTAGATAEVHRLLSRRLVDIAGDRLSPKQRAELRRLLR